MAGLNEKHYLHKAGWLRAAVLGANDGILSTASIAVGVAAAAAERQAIVLAALAGLASGAMSMAAGEYVSVSSQADTEKSDLERERKELEEMPKEELKELAGIYEKRGLSPALSMDVAEALTAHNALEAHARDELNLTELTTARPLQAALASFASFAVGAILPLLVAIFAPLDKMIWLQYGCSMFFLVLLGSTAAKAGGSPMLKASLRICFWGTAAMCLTALAGHLFGVNL